MNIAMLVMALWTLVCAAAFAIGIWEACAHFAEPVTRRWQDLSREEKMDVLRSLLERVWPPAVAAPMALTLAQLRPVGHSAPVGLLASVGRQGVGELPAIGRLAPVGLLASVGRQGG